MLSSGLRCAVPTENERRETEIYINISKIARKAADFKSLYSLLFLCIVCLTSKMQPDFFPSGNQCQAFSSSQVQLRRFLDDPETLKPLR